VQGRCNAVTVAWRLTARRVFDGVGGARRTRQGVQQGQLQPLGQPRGEALHIHLRAVPPLRLQKHLSRFFKNQGSEIAAQVCSWTTELTWSLSSVVQLVRLVIALHLTQARILFIWHQSCEILVVTIFSSSSGTDYQASTWWLSLSRKRTILSSMLGQ
jgi:hypothetical protein